MAARPKTEEVFATDEDLRVHEEWYVIVIVTYDHKQIKCEILNHFYSLFVFYLKMTGVITINIF